MPIIFPKREKRVQLVFVIHPKSPRLLEFKHIFEETKRIIWSKCRPDQFIRHNLPVNFSKDSDYIYLIETESVDAQVAQCQATLETCVLVEDDLVFLHGSDDGLLFGKCWNCHRKLREHSKFDIGHGVSLLLH